MATFNRTNLENGDSERQGQTQLLTAQALFKVVTLLSIMTVSIGSVIPRVYLEDRPLIAECFGTCEEV